MPCSSPVCGCPWRARRPSSARAYHAANSHPISHFAVRAVCVVALRTLTQTTSTCIMYGRGLATKMSVFSAPPPPLFSFPYICVARGEENGLRHAFSHTWPLGNEKKPSYCARLPAIGRRRLTCLRIVGDGHAVVGSIVSLCRQLSI